MTSANGSKFARFVIHRIIDDEEKLICEGVQFSNGKCVFQWMTNIASVVIHDSMENVRAIQGNMPGTTITYID